jgi:hypothetical protein
VDACNPLLQAHPTWARDEHEGRGIPTSLALVSGRLALLPPLRSPTRSTHLSWGTRHSLVGLRDPPVPKRRQESRHIYCNFHLFRFMFLPQKQFEKVQPSTRCNKSMVTPSIVTTKVKKLQSRSYRMQS